MFCCLRQCLNGNLHKSNAVVNKVREPEIHLDPAHMGEYFFTHQSKKCL